MEKRSPRHLVRMRLHPELYARVRAHAAEEGVSLAETIRRSIIRNLTDTEECAPKGESSWPTSTTLKYSG